MAGITSVSSSEEAYLNKVMEEVWGEGVSFHEAVLLCGWGQENQGERVRGAYWKVSEQKGTRPYLGFTETLTLVMMEFVQGTPCGRNVRLGRMFTLVFASFNCCQ